MGVTAENIYHSQQNQILFDGCQKAGYPCDTVPQNSGGVDHRCGFCSMGCPYGEKLGTHATWLHDAADAGAQFLDDAFVKRVLIDNKTRSVRGVEVLIGGAAGGTPMPSKQNTKYRLVVKAHTVVAACGTLHTPGLLQRSGLKNRNIGRNVRLHPVTVAMGFFPDRLVRPYEGPILTRVSNVAASAGGEGKLTAEVAGLPPPPPRTLPPTGYGVRIETPASYPGFSGSLFPFRSPLDHRRLVLQYPRTATLIVIARDFDSTASLSYDPVTAHVAVDFALGAKDARALGEGVLAAGRILSAAGAAEVNSAQHHVPPLVLDGAPDDGKASGGVPANHFTDLSVWARASLAEGVRPVRTNLACAHQMGSCRMAATPARGAVDPHGRAFEARGLYVADASLFPTASGVNPMLTTATIAYRVACGIRDELAAGSGAAAAKGKKGARL
ncbi:hypothetical protein HK405_012977 [Cladochytrium tenue]|nr:hypothetical protein HK405_012977 [Cladochytrium tenue]